MGQGKQILLPFLFPIKNAPKPTAYKYIRWHTVGSDAVCIGVTGDIGFFSISP